MHLVASVQSLLKISADTRILDSIIEGYALDDFCRKFILGEKILSSMKEINKLWYIGDQLLVSHIGNIFEELFCLAHDCLGHFGSDKAYAALQDFYYWPNICQYLEQSYIPACEACMQNKSPMSKPHGPLHPLSIPKK